MKKKFGFNFNKEVISKLQNSEMKNLKGGETLTQGFECNDTGISMCHFCQYSINVECLKTKDGVCDVTKEPVCESSGKDICLSKE